MPRHVAGTGTQLPAASATVHCPGPCSQNSPSPQASPAMVPHCFESHEPGRETFTPCCAAVHALGYVSPSQPHTGSTLAVQRTFVVLQTPAPSHCPTGRAQNAPLAEPDVQSVSAVQGFWLGQLGSVLVVQSPVQHAPPSHCSWPSRMPLPHSGWRVAVKCEWW